MDTAVTLSYLAKAWARLDKEETERATHKAEAEQQPACRTPAHATNNLTRDEQAAIAVLAGNIRDFERSLESVRGLPESLEGAPPEVALYFRTFTGLFERAYVAARAISSGAVKVQLSSARGRTLEAVLGAIGGGAESCGLPFAGLVSVMAAVIVRQAETKQTNLLRVFHEFFEGDDGGRDRYLVTYRMLAEQICLRSDFTGYSSRLDGEIKRDRARITKLLEPIRERFRYASSLTLENLRPVEVKATADLAALTEGVLRLHQDDHRKFCALKDSDDLEKIEYLLRLLGVPKPSVKAPTAPPCSRTNSMTEGTASARPPDRPSASVAESPGRSAPPHSNQSSRFLEIEGEIRRLREQNRRLLSGNRQTEALQRRLDLLETKVGSRSDIEASAGGGGGGAQIQAQLRRSRNVHSKDEAAAAESAAYRDVLRELQDLRAELAEVAERADANTINAFLSGRVLQPSEALELMETILRLAGVEVSPSGAFRVDRERHKLGFVPSSGLLAKPKYLWKGAKGVKVTQEHDGAKPVVYWFEKCGLSFFYAKHIGAATKQMFKADFLLVASEDSAGVSPSLGMAQDRGKLFG